MEQLLDSHINANEKEHKFRYEKCKNKAIKLQEKAEFSEKN